MAVGDLITGALDVMKNSGWCRGELKNIRGQYCAMGALNTMASEHWDYADTDLCEEYEPALAALVGHIQPDEAYKKYVSGRTVTTSISKVVAYNNSRAQFDEIRAWFEKAALDSGITV